MTFSASSGKVSYDGDGATTAFPTVFKFVLTGHVKAILRDAGDVETLWAEGSDYTLAGAGNDAGGTLSATVAPASGETLILLLDVPFTQEKSLPLGGAFPSTQVEEGLDIAAMGLAKLSEVDKRTLKVPDSDLITGSDLDLPIDSARAGKFLAFDQNGKPTPAVGTSGDLSPVSAYMDTLLASADAAAARGTLEAQEDVITARGDLVVGNAAPAASRLAKGAANRLLGADSNDVTYFGGTLAKTANYTVLVGDHRKLILVDATSGPVTITLPAVATAGDDFEVAVEKVDATANAVTVDGDGSETINGATTRTLTVQYQVETYRTDGSAWHVTGKEPTPHGLTLIASATANNDATINFTDLDSTYDHYILECINVLPVNDQTECRVRLSDDDGATFEADAGDYRFNVASGGSITSAGHMRISSQAGVSAISNVAGDFFEAIINIWKPADSSKTNISGRSSHIRADGTQVISPLFWGRLEAAGPTTAIQILLNSGNFAEGQFNLYGVAK